MLGNKNANPSLFSKMPRLQEIIGQDWPPLSLKIVAIKFTFKICQAMPVMTVFFLFHNTQVRSLSETSFAVVGTGQWDFTLIISLIVGF